MLVSPRRSASSGPAASVSAPGKGSGQRLGPRGACPGPPLSQGVLSSARGTPPPGTPRRRTQGRARAPRPRGGPEHSQPPPRGGRRGLLGLRWSGAGGRAAGGTWGLSCKASSNSSLSTAGMVSRGGAGGRVEGRRAGGAAAEAAPGSGDQADALCPRPPRARHACTVAAAASRPPALLPALSSPPFLSPPLHSSPLPSRRENRKCGEQRTGKPEVWLPLPLRRALREAADAPGR